jgi:hypothetical protein
MIFDVEGSDAVDRWDKREVYAQRTALFALVMSNLLIVNIKADVKF